MSKRAPLPRSVLLALGLTSGCQDCGSTHLGPCLSPIETVTPCLSDIPEPQPEPQPPPLDACLSVVPMEDAPAPAPEPQPIDGGGAGLDDPGDARQRVLARGVLPADVAAVLRRG